MRKYFLNENIETRVYLSQNGFDGFGYCMDIHLISTSDKIGRIVYRQKQYLRNKGYPNVLELHIGFEEEYQQKGFFQDAIIELLEYIDIPVFISYGRVINPNVFKAISKLDKLNIEEIEQGFIIKL